MIQYRSIGIEGYNNYVVSSEGKVFNMLTLKEVKGWANNDGYIRIDLCVGRIRRTCYIHRLVANAFLENPNSCDEVHHINHIRHDNRLINLEWCTRQENMSHVHQRRRARAMS